MEKLSEHELEEIKEAFAVFDTDGNGFISAKELKTFMESVGMKSTDNEVEEMINEVDLNGNKSIDFYEFVNLMLKDINFEDELKEAFEVFDVEKNGFLPTDQLKQIMMNMGEKFTEEETDQMLIAADQNEDGCVNVDELTRLMLDQATVPKKASSLGPSDKKISVVAHGMDP